MKNLIKKLLFLISFVALYVIVREAIILYNAAYHIHPYLSYAVIVAVVSVIGYFVVAPLMRIFATPASIQHVDNDSQVDKEKLRRLTNLKKKGIIEQLDLTKNEGESDIHFYDRAHNLLDAKADRIINRYAKSVFTSTAVSQNGFVDAVIMLSTSINMIKELFITYAGRVDSKSVLRVLKQVYYAVAISGSEATEHTAEEFVSKFTRDVSKNIPFADAFVGSAADGYANTVMCVRLGMVTKNYCTSFKIDEVENYQPTKDAFKRASSIITSMSKRGSSKALNYLQDKYKKLSWNSGSE